MGTETERGRGEEEGGREERGRENPLKGGRERKHGSPTKELGGAYTAPTPPSSSSSPPPANLGTWRFTPDVMQRKGKLPAAAPWAASRLLLPKKRGKEEEGGL